MIITRRQALMQTLFGAGGIGLRALATGLPAAFLLNPRRALAQGACFNPSKAQYVIMSTSGQGDPINANAPGTYAFPDILHSSDASMQPAQVKLAGNPYTMAAYYADTGTTALPQAVLDRKVFLNIMTNTPIHPKEPDVLKLMGATPDREMLPSLLAKATAQCFGTLQQQPLSVGGASPAEALAYNGSALPIIPPTALKDTLTSPGGPLFEATLQRLRDETMTNVYQYYRNQATAPEQAFIDNTVNTMSEVRHLNQSLLGTLSMIGDNGANSQIIAAVTLIAMNVAPVITIHIPFGGDNHSDQGFATEMRDTKAGIDAIRFLSQQLATGTPTNLTDKVTFMTLNVFGRTLATNGGRPAGSGRNHNGNHQVSLTMGKPFVGGVVGDIAAVVGGVDYGATNIDSTHGTGGPSGDIHAVDSLASFARSMMAAVGADPSVYNSAINSGPDGTAKVVQSAFTPGWV